MQNEISIVRKELQIYFLSLSDCRAALDELMISVECHSNNGDDRMQDCTLDGHYINLDVSFFEDRDHENEFIKIEQKKCTRMKLQERKARECLQVHYSLHDKDHSISSCIAE